MKNINIFEGIERKYGIKTEHILDARLYLNYHWTEVSAECISALCDISYREAKAIVDNYRNDEPNRGTYIIAVAAMLQQRAEEKELTR